jgi:hypothetical protein
MNDTSLIPTTLGKRMHPIRARLREAASNPHHHRA